MKKISFILSALFIISCTKDPIIYSLTTSANPANGGTVFPSTQQYDEGKTATITATPSAEYLFQSWSGATGTSNSTSVVMNSDKSVTANFIKKQYPLTIEIEGEGTVSEVVIKAGVTTDYNSGTIVELTAKSTGEWHEFVEWTGDIKSTENPIQITIDEAKTVKVTFLEKNLIINKTVTKVDVPGQSTEYLRSSFYNVSGPFHYLSDNEHYFFYPGTVFWGENKPNNKDEIPPSPSHVLKRVNGFWTYHKTYEDALFWGARNFDTYENKVVIGDGNEIGPDGTDWNGDTYYGEIKSQGEIDSVKVNDNQNRGFYHGTTFGDLNNDGLLDVGGAPGQWYENENKWSIKVFMQKQNMQFENRDIIFDYNETGHSLPFTLGFADLFGDEYGEIITADYGGGDPFSDSRLNRIEVFKYDASQGKYIKHFESSD